MAVIDLRTLYLNYSIVNIVGLLIVVILWYQSKKRFNGGQYWILDFTLMITCLLLIYLRGRIPDFVSMVLANTLAITGAFLGLIGLARFTGRKVNYLVNILFILTFAVIHTWFAVVYPDLSFRNLNFGIFFLFLTAQSAWIMLVNVPIHLKKMTMLTGIVFVLFSIVNAGRIVAFFYYDNLATDYLESGPFESAVILSYQLLFTLLAFSLVLMVNARLNKQIYNQEEKLTKIFQSAPYAILLTKYSDGKLLEVNNGFLDLFDYSKSEVIGKTTSELQIWHNDDDHILALKILKDDGKIRDAEYIYQKKNGELFPGITNSELLAINGETIILTIVYDITQRKEVETRISLAEKRFRGLIENAPDGVGIIDIKGNIVYASPNAIRHFGYGDDAIGRNGNEFTHPDDLPMVLSAIGKVLLNPEQKSTVSYRFRHASGKYFWIETTFSNMLNDSSVNGIVMNFTDISERRKMIGELIDAKEKAESNEKELQQINNELNKKNVFIQTILDNLPIGVSLNKINEGFVTYMNHTFEEIYGWSRDEISTVHTFFEKVYPDKEYRKEIMERVIEDIQSGDKNRMHWENITITNKNGAKKVINAVNIPLPGQNTMVSTVTDITDLYNTQQALTEAKEKAEESDKLKSAFLANMSHEIRTPMNGILGFTDLLTDPSFTGEEKQNFIEIIQQSGKRMLNTVNDLIDISKIETGQMSLIISETNINEQLQNIYEFFRPQAQLKSIDLVFKSTITESSAIVKTDVGKLDSILINLVKNALKFTDKGNVEVDCHLHKNMLEFSVSDTGIGIPAERQKAVFNRFEQADVSDMRAFEGSGLGLTISKAYIEMLGGKIELESEVGAGTVFRFNIQIENQDAGTTGRSKKETRPEAGTSLGNLKVLVAEDDPVGKEYLKIILTELDCNILFASNGMEAVEICRTQPDIDLILMDMRMPVLDGYKATAEIRKFNQKVSIFAQTAYALAGDRGKAIKAGCNEYITKPIKKEELVLLIRKRL